MGLGAKLHPLFMENSLLPQSGRDLLLWKDPIQTGAVVATLNLLFYLLTFGGYTIPQLMLSAFWVSLLARFVFVNAMRAATVFDRQYKCVPESVAKRTSVPYTAEEFQPVVQFLNKAFG